MAESFLAESMVPGMVALRDKKGKVTQHFPVDAREIMTQQPGEFKMVTNGSVEAARMNPLPLQLAQDTAAAQVVGLEGQVLVAMSAEDAQKWKDLMSTTANVEKPAEDATAPKTDTPEEKPAEKTATTTTAKTASK